jgi:hypothetical protein
MSVRTLSVLAIAVGILAGCASDSQPPSQAVSLATLPSISQLRYRVDPYIEAAGNLQANGKEAAFQQLLMLARTSGLSQFEDRQRIAVLCRMLFSKRPGSDFERPGLGAPSFLEGYPTILWADSINDPRFRKWSLEPIEIVDGVPFAIVVGYSYDGPWNARGTELYVRYCMTNCDWASTRFTIQSKRRKEAALRKLLFSPKWGSQLGDWERGYLRSQIQ